MLTDVVCKATLLNDYFRDQTLLDDSLSPPLPDPPALQHPLLESIYISPNEVSDVLKTLSLGKASGPDGINNIILIELSDQLSVPLCDLFNSSLASSRFPTQWKKANVSPLFKSGDPLYG